MQTAIGSTVRSTTGRIAAVLSAILLLNQLSLSAFAQDPTAIAIQASQQAAAQSQAAAQQASDQATQAAQQAAAQSSSSISDYSTSAHIERQIPVTAPDPNSPVPAQIASAHTVFLTNAGADPNFPIDPTQTYTNVYAALQSWGRFQLVNTPAKADLIFQLRDVSPIAGVVGDRNGVYSYNSPAYQLTIVDPHTNVPLWTVTSPVYLTGKNQVLARWVALSITNLISRIKVVAGEPLSSAESADLTTFPANHFKRNAIIITSAVIGAGVAGGLILHHEFENSLNNQKASQDKFCEANNIPLSECAGG